MSIDRPFIAFLLGVPAAMAGTTDDAVPDARYIEYAKAFSSYTAKLRGSDAEGRLNEATATLLDPHWAVTAAHAVNGLNGISLSSGDKKRKVAKVVIHPKWDEEEHGWNDIALLWCEEPLKIDFYPALSDGDEKPGQVVSIVGYGLHGKMSDGHGQYDGLLRAGTQTIERFERTVVVCLAKCGTSTLEFCISPGDSGGPLFAHGKLAGINSFTMANKGPLKSKSGEETAHTRVSLYADWIRETTEGSK
jgi:hypothetical protein